MSANIFLIGNVAKDVQSKETNGMKISAFSVANNMGKDKTNFYSVSCFGKNAEIASQYVKKGMKIQIIGTLEMREWTDNDGKMHITPNITCKSMEFLSKAKDESKGISDDELPF